MQFMKYDSGLSAVLHTVFLFWVVHQLLHWNSLFWQVMLLGRSPSVALIIANALMLITPFEALAETCEADQSVFNMPLLLFVALIGATVGGNPLKTMVTLFVVIAIQMLLKG